MYSCKFASIVNAELEFVGSGFGSGVFKDVVLLGSPRYLSGFRSAQLAYCATGVGLEIIDVSDYRKPRSIGVCATPGEAEALCVFGDYAYVADGDGGLCIIDVFDPTAPRKVGRLEIRNPKSEVRSYVMDVVVDGNYAYVVDCGYGLWVVDVTYPSYPRVVGSLRISGIARGIAIAGNYAYVVDYGGGVRVIDISIPECPYEVGSCLLPGTALKLAVYSGYVLVGCNDGMRVIDVSRPTQPMVISSWVGGRIVDLEITNLVYPFNQLPFNHLTTYAYLSDLYCGIRVVDISNILNPCEVGVWSKLGRYEYTQGLGVSGFLLGVCGLREGVSFFDISCPESPAEVGKYDAPGQIYGLSISVGVQNFEPLLYAASYEDGLRVINISEPYSPVEIGRYNTDGAAWAVCLDSFYACVADDVGGLWLLDTRIPSSPELVGKYKTPEYARGIATSGNYVYVANYSGGLSIIDISAPDSPNEVGRYNCRGYIWSVAYAGGYCYLAGGEYGLWVVDVRNPRLPKLVGHYDTDGYTWGLAVYASGADHPPQADYCYLADGEGGLKIIDISNVPFKVGEFRTPGCASGVRVIESYAYVACGTAGVCVVSVVDPIHPVKVAEYDTPGYARDIEVSGEYIYVADSEGGLITLRNRK